MELELSIGVIELLELLLELLVPVREALFVMNQENPCD